MVLDSFMKELPPLPMMPVAEDPSSDSRAQSGDSGFTQFGIPITRPSHSIFQPPCDMKLPPPGPGFRRLSDLITFDDDIAGHIEVYDSRTGKTIPLVHSVCTREGWLKRYVTVPGKPHRLEFDESDEIPLETLRGPWRIRPAKGVSKDFVELMVAQDEEMRNILPP